MARLNNKVALITGAAHGMGRAHAELFAKEGSKVVVTDRDERAGAGVAAQIVESGGNAIFSPLDVSSAQGWEGVTALAEATFGPITVLVNNAGTYVYGEIEAATESQWDIVNSVNARGTFLGCRAVVPQMKRVGGGAIVNVSSNFAIVGRPGFSIYCASKGAVRMMSKALAAELAPYGIRVNSLHPGLVATDMTRDLIATPESLDTLLGSALIRRAAAPLELAYAALFLASDESSYMTGAELVIDGGYTSV